MQKPGLGTGALVGLLLMLPLIVISALAYQIAALPFVPFDFFNFVRDNTPGDVIRFTLNVIIETIIALNLGRVDVVAKPVEQLMAMGMLVGAGVVAAAVYFAVMRGRESRAWFVPGLVLGVIVGAIMAFISGSVGTTAQTDSTLLNSVWIIALFVAWGLGVAWAHDRLIQPATEPPQAFVPLRQ